MYQDRNATDCLTPKLLDSLYSEALVMADEARSMFEHVEADLPARISLALSCESLKVTTRLMQVIAWLLNQKAYRAGELTLDELYSDQRSLGYAVASDEALAEAEGEKARLEDKLASDDRVVVQKEIVEVRAGREGGSS